MSSFSSRSSVITPSFQRLRGTVSSVTSTKSSTSGGPSIFSHLPRTLRETKYSSVHRLHKWGTQLLVPPTSAKMSAPRSAGRFSRRGWMRAQFSPNEEVRRGKWSTVLWVFAQERERPVVNVSFQLAQRGPEFVETKQASSEHLPQFVLV
ncbi:hypothetical protein T03_13540 [Trichinella britovi]|uniref:Uncharacterized protein n=1 Tax=Trichinella britovi TaxID=45882 RepID=A0A0V1C3V7_TRIBR|nr:hypothetical protein T03_13540 [Trichinella britovi]